MAAAAIVAACGGKDAPPPAADEEVETLAEDGADTNAFETDVELLTSSLVSSSATGELGLGDGVRAIYSPRGCVVVEHDAAARKATYAFRSCAGPSGLADVTGDLAVDFQQGKDRLHLAVRATDLAINGATIDWTAATDVEADGVKRTMRSKAQLAGTTARGRSFTRSNDHVVTWSLGERCFGLAGTSEGEVGSRALRVEITDYRRCRGDCPEAGGVVAITNVKTGARHEMRYDGTNRATLTKPNGKSVPVKLLCRA